ncbi:MAG: acyl carrier protein [Victivallales bacterium]|nr:acyl carrier protein [Victivallales bacterium]
MTRPEIQTAMIEILSDINPDVDWNSFGPEDSLRGTLESMDFLDVVMELRKRYHVEVPEADYGKLATMKGCVDYLEPFLGTK